MGSVTNSKWLPLDVDALDDPKIMALTTALGMEGYGIYIMLIQYLAKQEPDYSLSLDYLKFLAYRNHVSEEKLRVVVSSYGLFEIDQDRFWSNSLLRRMEKYDRVKLVNREKALKRWKKDGDKCNSNAVALPEQSSSNADKIREDYIREEYIRKEKKKDPSELSNSDVLSLENSFLSDSVKIFNQVIQYFPEECRPKSEKHKNDWIDTIAKLIKNDHREMKDIERVIRFARQHDFWKNNFLSVLKLRKKNKEGIMYFIVFQQLMNNQNDSNTIGRREKRVNQLWAAKDKERDYTEPQSF